MNHMEEVAKMLGVEIGEEFMIENVSNIKYKFNNDCFVRIFADVDWVEANNILVDLLNGKLKIVKLPRSIINDEEKEYLSSVIRPFREKVCSIVKNNFNVRYGLEFIRIHIKDDLDNDNYFYCCLPCFERGTMYKGMELDKEYSLEELGL